MRRPQRASTGPVPLKLELLEPDLLDTTRLSNGRNLVILEATRELVLRLTADELFGSMA